jgi:hypothetical protein
MGSTRSDQSFGQREFTGHSSGSGLSALLGPERHLVEIER